MIGGGFGGSDIGTKSNPMSRPRMLMCYICGREFGSKSLPIHIPQCQEKFKKQQLLLPKEQRRPLPKPPPTFGGGGGFGGKSMGGKMTQEQIDAQNDAAFEQYKENLSPCPNCGRRFANDRLPIHLKSCKPGHVLTPLAKGGAAASGGGGAGDDIPLPTTKASPKMAGIKPATSKVGAIKPVASGGGDYEGGGGSGGYGSGSAVISKGGGGGGGGGGVMVECDVCHQKFAGTQILSHYQSHFVECDMCHNKFPSNEILTHYKTHFGGGAVSPVPPSSTELVSSSSPTTSSRTRMHVPTVTSSSDSLASTISSTTTSGSGGGGTSSRPPSAVKVVKAKPVTSKTAPATTTHPPPPPVAAAAPPSMPSEESFGGGGEESEELVECGKCGRRFLPDRIAKHQKVCKGPTNAPKAHSTDIPDPPTEAELKAKAAGEKKAKWKSDHEALMAGMKAARLVAKYQKEGRSLAELPPPPPDEHPDYKQCKYCGRKFAPDVYERHAPRCATTQNKPAPPPKVNRYARKK